MPAATVGRTLGAGFFPGWLAGLLGFFSLALLVSSLVGRHRDSRIVQLGHGRVLVALLALLVATLLLERLGFLLTASLFLFILLGTISNLGWFWSAVASLTAAFLTSTIFQRLLEFPLPSGPRWFR
jgi:hypothetical protein